MIDFHSHILPRVDDGSKSLEMSLEMLARQTEQGVVACVATPHFYANKESVAEFIARRSRSADALKSAMDYSSIELYCGAEVSYYPGISRLPELERLCVEGTRLLIMEMPMAKWNDYTVGELESLALSGRFILIIAHLERYMDYQSKDVLVRLYQSGIRMQFSADYFLDFWSRRKAISMLRRGEIHIIGSDCHNITARPPNVGDAYKAIAKKLGEGFAAKHISYGHSLLGR